MIRLRLIAAATAALTVAGLAVTGTTASAATRRPAAVSLVRMYETAHGVRITWANPHSAYAHLAVRYQRGSTAPAIGAGTWVNRPRTATSATLTHLVPGAAYAVSIWTRTGTQYSARATTTFRAPRSAPAGRPVATGTLRGVVHDETNHPLAHVQIDLSSVAFFSSDSGYATTDASGRYHVTVPADVYTVGVDPASATGGADDATGYYATSTVVQVRAHTTSTKNLTLHAAGAISGRVLDKAGKPIRDVIVTESGVQPVAPVNGSDFEGDGMSYAITRADGTYTLRGASGYASVLCFTAYRYDPSMPGGYYSKCGTRIVAVAPRATRAAGDTALAAGSNGALSTRVTAGGHTVDSAELYIFRAGGDGDDGFDFTDGNGRAFDPVPAGRYVVCASVSDYTTHVSARSGYQGACAHAKVTARTTSTLSIDLPLGAAVSGTVVGPHGPLAGVSIGVRSGQQSGSALTDGAGRYTITGGPAGNYSLCAYPTDPQAGTPTGTRGACYGKPTPVLATAGTTRLVDLAVRAGAALRGTVSASHPVAPNLTDVYAWSKPGEEDRADATLGVDGAYALGGLGSARYHVCVATQYPSGPQYGSCAATRTTVLHTSRLNLTLPSTGTVVASATDSSGNGLSGVDAVLLAKCANGNPRGGIYGDCGTVAAFDDEQNVRPVASMNTLADGTVSLDGVRPGHYALCLLGSQAASATADLPASGVQDTCTKGFPVVVRDGATSTVGLSLGAGSTVSGRVTDVSGNGIAGVRVRLSHAAVIADDYDYSEDYSKPADAMTGADGRYTVHSVAPVAQTVCFDASGAGTSTVGYQDQCVGGAPGGIDDGSAVTIIPGANTVDQTLQTGHARGGSLRTAPLRSRATAHFRIADGGRSVQAVTTTAATLLDRLRTAARNGTLDAWWTANSSRLGSAVLRGHGRVSVPLRFGMHR